MKLINDNCMNIMPKYPDNYFDLAIVDPPYGCMENWKTGSEKKKPIEMYKQGKKWDKKPTKDYFIKLLQISKNQIIWGGNYFTDILKPSENYIVWDKLNPNMNFSEAEFAWMSFGNKIRIFKYYSAMEKKKHPTQKPIKLYSWLLQNYAKPDYKILDTHLGSGSHAIAWHYFQNGGEFVGIEIDKEYFDAAKKRIEKNTQQLEFNYETK